MEHNKLIAEFMGATVDKTERRSPEGDGTWFNGANGFLHPIHESSLEYHTSWDWLMPVVEKIESLDYDVDVKRYGTIVHNINHKTPYMLRVDVCESPKRSKIGHAYLSVVQFIQWYNSNK